jgi:colicin import membrane protein/protein TonB
MLAGSAVAAGTIGCAHHASPPVARDLPAEDEQYLRLVVRELQSHFVVPQSLVERAAALKATLVLYIEPDGRLARWVFEARSGDAEFDSSLAEMVERAHFPPPPEALRQKFRTVGLGVIFRH